MKRALTIAGLLVFGAVAANAQQAPKPLDTTTQALYSKLSEEIQTEIQLRSYIIQLQGQVKDLTAAVDALNAKIKAAEKK